MSDPTVGNTEEPQNPNDSEHLNGTPNGLPPANGEQPADSDQYGQPVPQGQPDQANQEPFGESANFQAQQPTPYQYNQPIPNQFGQQEPPAQFGQPMPGAPIPNQPGMAAVAAPKKPLNKGLIIGISVGGGILVLAIIFGFLVWSQLRITAADYYDASDKASQAYTALSSVDTDLQDLSSSMIVGDLNEEEVDEAVKSLDNKWKKLDTRMDEFTQLKAYNDEDVSEAYTAYEKKVSAYKKYNQNLVEVLPTYAEFVEACKTTDEATYADTDDVGTVLDALSSCHDSAAKLAEVNEEDFSKLGTDYDAQVVALQDILTQLQSLGSDEDIWSDDAKYDQYMALTDQLYDIDVYSVESEFTDNLQDKSKKLDPSGALNDLQDVISDKMLS